MGIIILPMTLLIGLFMFKDQSKADRIAALTAQNEANVQACGQAWLQTPISDEETRIIENHENQ